MHVTFSPFTSFLIMSYIEIAQILKENVSDEGVMDNKIKMANRLFSSFNDPKIWSPISIDCAMPMSSFYIAKLTSKLSPININDDDEEQDDEIYLIVRHTEDDITKYLDYLKLEYQSYFNMEMQVNEIIFPIGYTQNISIEGFLFAFLTTTNLTLNDAINDIKDLSLQTKFQFAINLVDNLNDAYKQEMMITGFHITPKTILVNLQNDDESIGFIGFIGKIDELKLCPTAVQFLYNQEFSPFELRKKIKPTVRAPNSISDVYGLAKIVQFIIGDDLSIPEYKKLINSALQKNQSHRISLEDFLNQMLEIQKEVSTIDEKPLLSHPQPKAPSVEEEEKPTSSPIIQKIRLIDKIKDLCIQLPTETGCPQIYKLPKIITNSYPEQKIRKVIVGPYTNAVKNDIKILIVGQTGSGKTTFINGISNYLYGVKWEDNCRFKIVSDEDENEDKDKDMKGKNDAFSQTEYVTAYTLPWQPEFPVPYNIVLIDTPGFADTRGFQRDIQIVDQLDSLFKNKNNCGVDSLNAVAFVVQSSLPRLNPAQRYIFDSIMKLFGKDIANNFIIVSTFADAKEPLVLSALKEAKISTNYVSKFNNSALFAKGSVNDENINRSFWEIGQAGYSSIFTNINKLEPKSLTLTKDVLDERKILHASIEGLSNNIRDGIAKMNEIEQECRIIDQYKTQIKANKDFTICVKVLKSRKTPLKIGEYVTNCSHCNKTCHYPCHISQDCHKNRCAAMNKNGKCNICGCNWQMHYNMQFRWEVYEDIELRTSEEIKSKYGDAKAKKQNRKKMLEKAENEYQKIWESTSQSLNKCKCCVNRLREIALMPISLSGIDYIKILIEGEKQRCEFGWEDRIKWYEELIEQQKLIIIIDEGRGNDLLPHQKTQSLSKRVIDFLEKKLGFKIPS